MDTNAEACIYDVNGVSYNSDDQRRKILHKHGDYDLVIFQMLSIGSTKRNIRDSVTAKNRPSNIDENLWSALSSYDKAHRIERKIFRNRKLSGPNKSVPTFCRSLTSISKVLL